MNWQNALTAKTTARFLQKPDLDLYYNELYNKKKKCIKLYLRLAFFPAYKVFKKKVWFLTGDFVKMPNSMNVKESKI